MRPAWDAYKARRMCIRKVRYKHAGQAQREASRRKMRAYLCPRCDCWHLTTQVDA